MEREGIQLYYDYLDAIKLLGDAERGRLFVALLEYGKSGVTQELSGNERFIFAVMKSQIDMDKMNKSKNKGGAPTGNQNAKKQPVDFENNLKQPKQPVDFEEKEDIGNSDELLVKHKFDDIVSAWNSLGLTAIKIIQGKREEYLNARIRQYGIDNIFAAIENVKKSKFLQGRLGSKPFVLTFDWFILPNNFPKVLEGNYTDKSPNTPDNSVSPESDNPFLLKMLAKKQEQEDIVSI